MESIKNGLLRFFKKTWEIIKAYFRKDNVIISLVLTLLIQAAALCLMESFYYKVSDISLPKYLYNLLFWLIITALFTFVTGRLRWGSFITVLLSGILGTAQYMCMIFRDSPILPWDVLSLGTALSVVGNYEFQMTEQIEKIYLYYALLLGLSLLVTLKIRRKKLLVRSVGAALSILLCLGYSGLSQVTEFQEAIDYYPYLFTPKAVYKRNGFAFSFTSLLKYVNPAAPEGYDPKELEEFAKAYESDSISGYEGEAPNIIVVMDEAFSDLAVLGELVTDTDYMPFFRSLTDNSIKGYTYVSVNGGNTANSEYEFLTGDTMAFLPAGCIPYQQYIKGDYSSLVSQLNDIGFYSTAMHPYNASGWYRDSVYQFFGFTNSYFRSSFGKADLRSYVSDLSCFRRLVSLYNNYDRIEDKPFFNFCITMQNHGGYSDSLDYKNFKHIVTAYTETNSSAVSSYVSLIKYTDNALEFLINYFKHCNEPTVVVFFGDHLPTTFITNPVLRQNGIDPNGEMDIDTFSNLYKVPFLIWANYDIEERYIEATSLNYLSAILCETAELPLTGYQKFLLDLSEKYPAISANFVIDAEGSKKYIHEVENDPDILRYMQLQYNHLFEKKAVLKDFFTLKKQ